MGEIKGWFQRLRRKLLEEREREVKYIQKVQSFRNPVLDKYFYIASQFGEEFFYITFLPLTSWHLGNKEAAHMVVLMLFFGIGIGNCLKNIFLVPRPPHPRVWTPEGVQKSDHGFPSTHTITFVSAPIYFMLYHYIDKIYRIPFYPITFTTALVAISICSLSVIGSCIYNGYHSFQDVLGGTGYGLLLAALFYTSIRHSLDFLLTWNSYYAPLVAFAIPALLLTYHPRPPEATAALPESGMTLGTTAGTVVGVQMGPLFNLSELFEPGLIPQDSFLSVFVETEYRLQLTRFLIGMIIVGIIRAVCKIYYTKIVNRYYLGTPVEKDVNWIHAVIKFLNYFTIAFAITCWIQILFRSGGLHTDYDLRVPNAFPTGHPRT
jgi:membrane-associated phospholipid phosphatase